jgi:hypothetical protein
MRRASKSIIAGMLLSLATAAFSGAAKAAACVSDALDKNTAPGFTCSIGDMTFANFTWKRSNSPGGIAPSATSDPVDGPRTASKCQNGELVKHTIRGSHP